MATKVQKFLATMDSAHSVCRLRHTEGAGYRSAFLAGIAVALRLPACIARADDASTKATERGLAFLAGRQHDDGSIGTGHYYAAQAMSHASADHWNGWSSAAKEKLISQQRNDGSWPDTASTELGTAMAYLTLQTGSSK